jgi:nucleotide-binding universal stress UspA family protein
MDILVPVDFSPGSRHAADLAVEEAVLRHRRVTLLHVCAPHNGVVAWSIPPLERPSPVEVADCERALAELARTLRYDHPAAEIDYRVREGDAAEVILQECARGVERIVCGRRGKSSPAGIGSVVERLLRDSPVPVLLVPPPAAILSRIA